jgi:DNA-binding transcriptional MerR regulator
MVMSERSPKPRSSQAIRNEGLLSIGDLSKGTGITPDAIRSWERRYGRPRPVRRPSGHRRYTYQDLRWLRKVAQALGRGHRASIAVLADDAELESLLGDASAADEEEIRELLRLVRSFDRVAVLSILGETWSELGPYAVLERWIVPLTAAVGRAWADGELDIRHEHFLTEVLQDYLRGRRVACGLRPGAPTLVLTTLPGERHGLGLQMAALVGTLEGIRARVLGTETPVPEIVQAAREAEALGVAISVSSSTGGVATDRMLSELRGALPDAMPLIVGGGGACGPRRPVRGVLYLASLDELGERLRKGAL